MAVEGGFAYNDLDSVERAVEERGGDVAAIFVGGCSYPYSGDTVEPSAAFARGLRRIADRCGALLVLDEIRTNFRMGGATAMAAGATSACGARTTRAPRGCCWATWTRSRRGAAQARAR